MISFLITAIKFIFLLGFLVLIHEGGHFIVAKLCKVKVHDFAIGFGPIILKKKKGDTLYSLRLFPLGGFVRMEGEEKLSEDEGSFSKKSVPQRIAIVMAGATVNILFGLLVYFILVSSTSNYVSNKVETVESGYGAEISGILPNDEIIEINGKNIHLRSDMQEIMSSSNGEEVEVKIKRNDEIFTLNVLPTKKEAKSTGIYFLNGKEEQSTKIVAVYPDSPAEKAGLKQNDIIIKVNGEDVENDPYKAVELTQNASESEIEYTIIRNNSELNIKVTPNIINQYYLGVTFSPAEKSFVNNIKYGFWDTLDFSVSIVDNLKMLFSGKVSTDQLMGPIGISTLVADTNGIVEFIYLLALISLSLGVTNLIPIPPLDGWKVVLYIIEGIRKKPMNENLQIQIESLGFLFMILLSIYVAYNDILRI